MHQVYLGLGSNLGDRQAYLDEAMRNLSYQGLEILKVSSVMETPPLEGGPPQGPYLNLVLLVVTELSPFQLLKLVKQIEVGMGRKKRQHWGPREIDIDILFYDQLILDTLELQIPHLEVLNRNFVYELLLELDKNLIHPGFQRTLFDLVTLNSNQASFTLDVV